MVARYAAHGSGSMSEGRLMLEVVRQATACDLRTPPELSLLGKTLLNLEQVSHALDPELDVKRIVERHLEHVMRERLKKSLSLSNLASEMIEVQALLRDSPRKVSDILSLLAENKLQVRMQSLFSAAADEGITHVLSGEVLRTRKGLTVTSRLTDLRRNVELGANRQEALQPDEALSFSTAIASVVKQGLGLPGTEKVDVFAANFASHNIAAYEAFIAGMQDFLAFDYTDARQSFEVAVQKAPEFAMGPNSCDWRGTKIGTMGWWMSPKGNALRANLLGALLICVVYVISIAVFWKFF